MTAIAALDLCLDVEVCLTAGTANSQTVPSAEQFENWVRAALQAPAAGFEKDAAEISLRIVDIDEITELNHRYRGKDYATNVLSFPADLPPELGLPHLGDIVICAPVVEREAYEQHKAALAHWAHMIVHGTLHLLGFDHIDDADALQMETLEIEILRGLNVANPYLGEDVVDHV